MSPVQESRIAWTDSTWNPATGCTEVSPGCDHCYARTFAEKWRGKIGHPYEHGFDLQLRPERLEQPLHWRKPRRIFVNSMSDLFHAKIPEAYIAKVADVMRRADWHTFQVLTKRADRLERVSHRIEFPANVWLGVSVETPAYYARVRHLQRARAATRFLSCEPLLAALPGLPLDGIGWVIDGGESGNHMSHPDNRHRWAPDEWFREIRDQCVAAGVAYFHKQGSGVRSETDVELRELDGSRKLWRAYPDDIAPPPPPDDLFTQEG